MEKLRILIADDQTLMRDGLKTILELEEDMEVVGTAQNGLEACELTAKLLPDLVLLDVKMPGMDGVSCVRKIKEHVPDVKLLMLSTFDTDEYIIEALAYGANGFLLKEIPVDRLVQLVRDCAKGQMMLPANVAAKLAARLADVRVPENRMREYFGSEAQYNMLTEKEKWIAYYMIQNYSNKEIAQKMNITEGTLKNYISVIYGKIGTNDRRKAIDVFRKMFRGGNGQA